MKNQPLWQMLEGIFPEIQAKPLARKLSNLRNWGQVYAAIRSAAPKHVHDNTIHGLAIKILARRQS